MGKVVTYGNSKYKCFCQIKLDSGERLLISIVNIPTPSVKLMKLRFFGLCPVQTIWEYNPTMADPATLGLMLLGGLALLRRRRTGSGSVGNAAD